MRTLFFSPHLVPVTIMAGSLIVLFSNMTWAGTFAGNLDGGISLGQTRVVFLSTDKTQTLTVKNTGSRSWLIQSRIQRGAEDTIAGPFLVTPPLFSMQPDSRQLLRIVSLGNALPADRESLFVLSVVAIPAAKSQATADGVQGQVSMGIRFTLKLFYRPIGLLSGVETAACQLRFTVMPVGVRAENPTPYFQTLGQLMLNGTPINLNTQPSMLAPFGSQIYRTGTVGAIQADWQTVTDYGGLSDRCQQTVSATQETS